MKLTSRQLELLRDIQHHPANRRSSGRWKTFSGDWFADRTAFSLYQKRLAVLNGPGVLLSTVLGATVLEENE